MTSTNPAARRDAQVLGDARLADPQGRDECAYGEVLGAQQIEDAATMGLRQDLEHPKSIPVRLYNRHGI